MHRASSQLLGDAGRHKIGHKFSQRILQGTGVDWHGFHAFRRGLGTRLFNNGVPTKTIAAILRHGSGSEVTEANYIDVDESTAVAALKSLPKKSTKGARWKNVNIPR